MIRIILLLTIFAFSVLSQQTNYTFGYKTDGTKYTQTGTVDVDSITTHSIILDFQDYYRVVDDTYGVLFVYFDAESATDSVNYWINFRNGGYTYQPNDASRINTTNISWADDTTAVQALSRNVNDLKWKSYEIVISGQMLPPEFGRIDIKFNANSNDNLDIKHYFVYSAVNENVQRQRNVDGDVRNTGSSKSKETLH